MKRTLPISLAPKLSFQPQAESTKACADTKEPPLHDSEYKIEYLNSSDRKNLDHKKQNGVFYTPDVATRLLATWAIRRAEDLVMEPSFGGCGFLNAALDRFTHLEAAAAARQLYGCDIDPKAFEHLTELFASAPGAGQFLQQDFLSVELGDFGIAGVDALIGNPPYVSWHKMLLPQRAAASMITTPAGNLLKKKGSLWAFFVIHSLKFLKQDGRMAWILPSGFLHADYAAPLRRILAACFARTLAVSLNERLFLNEGTEESSVILLCEGYQTGKPGPMRLTSAENLAHLEATVRQWTNGKNLGANWDQQAALLLSPAPVKDCYTRLKKSESYGILGQLFKIRIGLVTGDNKFFVLSKTQAAGYGLPATALKPIVARLVHCKGLAVRPHDLVALENTDARCLLVDTLNGQSNGALASYLNSYPEEQRVANYTFNKRTPWYQVNDGLNPDAFFSCMSSQGPTLVLNSAGTTCTNTVYRVWFTNAAASNKRKCQVALSLQSTFSQFSAEVVGRSHGSSALKLEPSEVLQLGLLLPAPDVNPAAAYEEVDALLRLGESEAARQAADSFLVSQGLLTEQDAKMLETGLLALRAIRQRTR